MTRIALAVASLLLATGCATMFEHPYKNCALQSIPDSAGFELYRLGESEPMQTGVTPASLHLKRGRGYFKPQRYRVVVHKDGWESEDLTFRTSTNANYWWNLGMIPVLAGWPFVSMVIVDPLTGSMWDIDVPTAIVLRRSPGLPPAQEVAPEEQLPQASPGQ